MSHTLKRSTAAIGAVVAGMVSAAKQGANGVTLDSAAANEYLTALKSRPQDDVNGLPETAVAVFDEFNEDGKVTQAILDSAAHFEREHGMPLPSDLAELALHNAYSVTDAARAKYGSNLTLDSATSSNHDPLSLQPNRAVVAIMAAIGEACPFVHYLPADIQSNEARIAILSHKAESAAGKYGANDSLDGINAGYRFMSSMRTHTVTPDDDGLIGGKITALQTDADTCNQTVDGQPTLRGRLEVYVNGLLVGREANSGVSGANPVNGRVVIGGVPYVIGGTHNPDTGVFALTSTPKLPTTVPVMVQAPLDFEKKPELVAITASQVEVFSLFASPVRARTRVSPDSQTQFSNELGLDPFSENVLMFQRQFGIERHFDALDIAKRVSVNQQSTYDFQWSTRSSDMTRARLWLDFIAELGKESQKMVEATLDHGITHLYAGKDIVSQWAGLGSDFFVPSGVPERPGIYRVGRLAGKYEVYYNPRATETANSSQILAIGKASTVARNCVVAGDAVAPAVLPLQRGDDFKNGAGLYGRSFMSSNPHHPSALGAARINVTNLR